MRHFFLLAIVSLWSLSATAEQADTTYSGNELLTDCQSFVRIEEDSANLFAGGACYGFLRAYGEMVVVLQTEFQDSLVVETCFPEGVTMGQLARVVLNFLEEHPERLHERAITLTSDAFLEAFPCS